MDQLTNYEVLELFANYTSDGASHFMNFLAVFSAYLVAGFLAAGRLGIRTMIALGALYLLVVSMTATGSYLMMSATVDIAREIAARNMDGASYLVSAATTMSGAMGEVMLFLNPTIQLLACIGSIAFIFRHRAEQVRHET